ncbi:MAG: hypothetical protein IID41_16325 [Planctomycetes bacterium]|nr:hypothetical protein [Planctomycetota bacterium]
MPKSKNALALLEVLRREDMKPVVGNAKASSTGQSARPPAPQVAAATADSPPAMVRAEGDRLKFSVSTLTLAMVVFLTLVVLAGAFALGRRSGYGSGWQAAVDRAQLIANDEFLDLRAQPPNPGVLQDLDVVRDAVNREQAQQRRTARTGQVGFIDDLNYVWIETFTTKGDATTAREYLKGKGIESTLIASGGKWVLISKEGFDYGLAEEKAACQRLSARVREVGQQYLEAGGRYGFICFAKKKVPGSTW